MEPDLRDLSLDVLEHGEALFVVDSDFRIILVNRNFERLAKMSRKDILGRGMWEIFAEAADPQSQFWTQFQRAMRERAPAQFEEYYAPLEMWTAVTVFPTQQNGLAAFFRDVTSRRAIEDDMARSRVQLEAVFQTMRDGVVVFNMHGEAILVNDAEAVMNGYPSAGDMKRDLEYFGRVYELSLPNGTIVPQDQWPVARVLRGESLTDVELRGRRRDTGQEWVFSFSGEPVRDEHGKQVLAVILTRDISERKRAETERERLLQALRDEDRRKNEFLAMLSHELRNPLAPISNSVTMLDHVGSNNPQALRARAIIHRQVNHMTRLIDDLLDITRISQGRLRIRKESLDLTALVAEAVEDARNSFDNAGVGFTYAAPPQRLDAVGDAVRLAQVVGNLLQNAAKFTPRGGEAALTLTFDAAAGRAVLLVHDSGMGVPADLLPRLFEPFSQAASTLDRGRGGLGLGLALVKNVVELHGGTAEISSPGANQGTNVTVRLPARLAAPVKATPPAKPNPAKAAVRRVLIIEDNIDAAETLRDVLQLAGGHDVAVANTGNDGLAMARKIHPDVVLCDIGLPGMDGYQVAAHMRADPEVRGTKLIALSGYAAPDDVMRAKEAGFDMHLAKPPSIEQLTHAIE